jgi:predicted methyltransferase
VFAQEDVMAQDSPDTQRRWVLGGLAGAALLGACDRKKPAPQKAAAVEPAGPPQGTLDWAVAGDWRAADRSLDRGRHPVETLSFFGLRPEQTIVEFWPGKGYWSEILAPYLAHNKGELTAAVFELGPNPDPSQKMLVERFQQRFGDKRQYGDVTVSAFGPASPPPIKPGTADLVLFMQTVAEWMGGGLVDKAFRDAFLALKPGGTLGVVQPRAKLGGIQDPAASDGYVQEPYLKQLAAEAGFAFSASSEINANPKDTKDYPFGVWTLPPTRLSAPRGQPDNLNFNHAKYDLIGESDRMTLRFRKPV